MSAVDFDKTEELDLREIRKELRKVETGNDPKRTGFTLGAQFGIIASLIITLTLTAQAFYLLIVGPSLSLIDIYSSPLFTGRNGEGTIVEFHGEKKAVDTLTTARDHLASHDKNYSSLDLFLSSVECSFDQTENLSNGDTVVYACKYNTDAAGSIGYRLTDTSVTYTVHGLSESDPFLHLEPKWSLSSQQPVLSGTDPDYHYSYRYEDPVLTVYAENALSLYSKEYTIGTLPLLITERKDLTDRDITTINEIMKNKINDELSSCKDTIRISEAQLITGTPYLRDIKENNDHIILTYTLNHIQSSQKQDTHHHFTITYETTIYRTSDGSISLEINNNNGCKYTGSDTYHHTKAK